MSGTSFYFILPSKKIQLHRGIWNSQKSSRISFGNRRCHKHIRLYPNKLHLSSYVYGDDSYIAEVMKHC